jgi:tRNA pseudouridine synthase 10
LKILKIARALLESNVLCDHCLGRQFALLSHGQTNDSRGEIIKLLLVLEGHRLVLLGKEDGKKILQTVAVNGLSNVSVQTLRVLGLDVASSKNVCYLCEDNFVSLNDLAQEIIHKLSDYEYQTMLIGIKVPLNIEEKEDELRAKFRLNWGESIRNEFSREIGKRVLKVTGKIVDYKRPDILVLVNPFTNHVNLQINSLFIGGKYKKLIRGIPQARWLCRDCSGQGCVKCNWTGKRYTDSVEELIATPILEETFGSETKFHAAGREDIDARVLGFGRPFIVEMKNPKKRFLDLNKMEKKINNHAKTKVEVRGLVFVSKEDVRRLKIKGQVEKIYRAMVEFESEICNDELSRIEKGLSDKLISQMTPQRVLHRRADKMRKKYLYEVNLKKLGPTLVEMLIRSQGGLYIKELITGDGGRTKPSISEITDIPAKCVELDVLKICMEDF